MTIALLIIILLFWLLGTAAVHALVDNERLGSRTPRQLLGIATWPFAVVWATCIIAVEDIRLRLAINKAGRTYARYA